MNKFWKIFRVLLFAVFLAIVAGALFVIMYGDEIKKIFVEEINKHLEARIDVSEMRFSLLKKFPGAALEFKNVIIYSPTNFIKSKDAGFHHDTLLSAENLYLQFSITDLFKKNYIIKAIHVKNGKLNVEVSGNGMKNFIVWKTTGDKATSKVTLQLKDVRFTNMEARYLNRMNHSDFWFFTNRFNMRGELSKGSGKLEISSDLFIRHFLINDKNYVKNINASTSFKLQVFDKNYEIEKGEITVSGLDLRITGKYLTWPSKTVNLSITGENLDIQKLINILPKKISDNIDNYEGKGFLKINSTISGNYGRGQTPHIETSFTIVDGELKEKNIPYLLKIRKVTGRFTNGAKNSWSTTLLDLQHYEVNIGESDIHGSFSISSFPHPNIDFQATGEIDFAKWIRFFDLKKIEKGSGKIHANISLSGKLSDEAEQGWGFLENLDPRGRLEFYDIAFKIRGNSIVFKDINGNMAFRDNVWLDGLKMNIGGEKITIEGKIGNVLSHISGKEAPLLLEATVRAEYFNPVIFIDFPGKKDNADTNTKPSVFPDNLYLDLNLEIGQLNYKRFTANNFKGNLLYKPGMLSFNSVTFKSMNGNFSGSGVVFQNINGQFLIRTQSTLKGINIKELFYSFNNFDQEFITDKHVNGTLTGEISFSSQWTNNLKIIKKKILAESSVKITDGELIDFEPMLGLARYINISELKHIRFSELDNRILIRDETITIQQTEIQSSAFNISLSGTHHFDNRFSYKTKVLLSKMLASKVKRMKTELQEFGEIDDDGLGKTSLYLSIEGTPDDYHVSYDKKAAVLEIKKNLQKEKYELKKILHEELGMFSKDTSRYPSDNVYNKNKFKILWDENKKNFSRIDTPRKSTFRILWEENDTSEIR